MVSIAQAVLPTIDGGAYARLSALYDRSQNLDYHQWLVIHDEDRFILELCGVVDLRNALFPCLKTTFHSDTDGHAKYDQTFKPCLQLSGAHLAAGLAVNWHSDGKTYGVEPGEFGKSAHIQLYSGLLARADL